MNGSLDITPLIVKLDKIAVLTNADLKDLILQQATLFVYSTDKRPGIINIMPPFSQKNKGADGLAAGRASIDRDLAGIFDPVTIKGERTINHLFGDRNPDVLHKPPYVVKTVEKWPDVQAIYDQRNAARHGKRLTRGRKQPYYVDAKKLISVRNTLHSRVGWACACWWRACVDAGLSPRGVPDWIKKHEGAPGTATITTTDTAFHVSLTSSLSYNVSLNMETKVRAVLSYRDTAIKLRLPYIIRGVAKRLQLAA